MPPCRRTSYSAGTWKVPTERPFAHRRAFVISVFGILDYVFGTTAVIPLSLAWQVSAVGPRLFRQNHIQAIAGNIEHDRTALPLQGDLLAGIAIHVQNDRSL
jgi:hypothetical protein